MDESNVLTVNAVRVPRGESYALVITHPDVARASYMVYQVGSDGLAASGVLGEGVTSHSFSFPTSKGMRYFVVLDLLTRAQTTHNYHVLLDPFKRRAAKKLPNET